MKNFLFRLNATTPRPGGGRRWGLRHQVPGKGLDYGQVYRLDGLKVRAGG